MFVVFSVSTLVRVPQGHRLKIFFQTGITLAQVAVQRPQTALWQLPRLEAQHPLNTLGQVGTAASAFLMYEYELNEAGRPHRLTLVVP